MLRFLVVSAFWSVSLLAWQPAKGESPPVPVVSETVELVGHKMVFEEFACPTEGGAGDTSIDVSLDDRFLGTLDFCLESGSTVKVVIVSGGEEFDGGGRISMNEHCYPRYYPEAYIIIVFYGWYEDGRHPCAYIDLRYRSNARWAHRCVPDWDPATVDPEADAATVRSIFADLATKDPYHGMASFYGRKGVEVKPILFSEGVLIVTGVSLDAYDMVQPDGSTVRDPCAAPEGGWGGRNPNGHGNPGQPGCCAGSNSSGGDGGDADPGCASCNGGEGGAGCGTGNGGNGGKGAGCGNGGNGGNGGNDGGHGGNGGDSGADCGYGGNGGNGGAARCQDNPDHSGGHGGNGGNGVQGGGAGGRGGAGTNGGHGGQGGNATGPSGAGGKGGCGGNACGPAGSGGNGGNGGNGTGRSCGGGGGCGGSTPPDGNPGHPGNPGQPGPDAKCKDKPPTTMPTTQPVDPAVSQGTLSDADLWW